MANYSTEVEPTTFSSKKVRGVFGAELFNLHKAFNTVSHKILLAKLSTFNFPPLALHWFESYLIPLNSFIKQQNNTGQHGLPLLIMEAACLYVMTVCIPECLRMTGLVCHCSVLS